MNPDYHVLVVIGVKTLMKNHAFGLFGHVLDFFGWGPGPLGEE